MLSGQIMVFSATIKDRCLKFLPVPLSFILFLATYGYYLPFLILFTINDTSFILTLIKKELNIVTPPWSLNLYKNMPFQISLLINQLVSYLIFFSRHYILLLINFFTKHFLSTFPLIKLILALKKHFLFHKLALIIN